MKILFVLLPSEIINNDPLLHVITRLLQVLETIVAIFNTKALNIVDLSELSRFLNTNFVLQQEFEF